MRFPRSCGTLVHPTSLPGPWGMGDFGREARQFLDLLHESGQTIWQVLPLSPVSYGNSPYNAYSAFAGNEYLINLEILQEQGLLTRREVEGAELPEHGRVDFDRVYSVREPLYRRASERFYRDLDRGTASDLERFRDENRVWLDDYALYRVLLRHHEGAPWNRWDRPFVQREPAALERIRREHGAELRHEVWLQFEFYRQWLNLKAYANSRSIRIIGDLPIFVAHNSADVWARPEYYTVNREGDREWIAGVPPDYFSETGQLWGNPLYRWDRLRERGYDWWVERFRQMFVLYDAIRVDHFRGFEAFWQVDAREETAINGRWVKGPGSDFFTVIERELGRLPIIAEDLGLITPDVEALRDQFNFPGMKILQFAFDNDPENSFLPHNYEPDCVVYSGTHDNDTTVGWYRSAPEEVRHQLRVYLRSHCSNPAEELIRLGVLSVADQAIFPLQDFMALDSEHRMNRPGTAEGNWAWRFTREMLDTVDTGTLRSLFRMANRIPALDG